MQSQLRATGLGSEIIKLLDQVRMFKYEEEDEDEDEGLDQWMSTYLR